MDERIRNLVNAVWDREAEKRDIGDGLAIESLVSLRTGFPKRTVLLARRGYRRPEQVRPGPGMPRVSILEAANDNAPRKAVAA